MDGYIYIFTIFPLHWLVDTQFLVQPFVALAGGEKLSCAQAVSNTLEAIAKAVGEIICGIYDPLIASPKVRSAVLGDAKGGQVPHLWIVVPYEILLHAQKRRLWFVLPVAHITELLEVRVNVLGSMDTVLARQQAIFTTSLQLEVGLTAMTHIGLAQLDQFLGEVI
jgi:hypothetical protein